MADRLSTEAQLQLLLLLPDSEIISLIDDLVLSRTIRIPVGETRELSYLTPRLDSDSGSELSALGIRSADRHPTINLTSAIWRTYQLLNLPSELEWRVRGGSSKSLHEALVSFVRNHGPAESVRELILSSATVTANVCADLGIPLKYASGTDDATVDRLLWKLGFNPMQFDDSIQRFHTRLSELRDVVLTNTPIENENAREKVRASGVNLFVSLEEFLDRLISYNIWILSSDHFLITKFRYSSPNGRAAVARVLGNSLLSGETTVSWTTAGENPLGTLLRYLRAAAEWIRELPSKDRGALLRPRQDLPHFADDKHVKFPFQHLALWADSDLSELQRYSELFGRAVKLVEESEPASIRNGLDHFREPERFPNGDKLLACVARLRQALETADVHRLLPRVFWLFGTKQDRFGAIEHEFRDYAARVAVTYGPELVSGLESISYDTACLLAPGNLLGTPNSTIVFQLHEQSEYSAHWQDYPRRRKITAKENGKSPSSVIDGSMVGGTGTAINGDPQKNGSTTEQDEAGHSVPDAK